MSGTFTCGDISFTYSDVSSVYPFYSCLTCGFVNVTMLSKLHDVNSGTKWDEVLLNFATMEVMFNKYPNDDGSEDQNDEFDDDDDMITVHKYTFKMTV